MGKLKKWICNNASAIILVFIFILIFILTQNNEKVLDLIGTASIEYLNNQFYRWMSCIFYHYNFSHIFFNSLALICIGSILTPFIGNIKTIAIFLLGGTIAEIPYSLIVHDSVLNYGGGSSGGIFALIAAFIVCFLRFPKKFQLKWFRPDLLIVIAYFIFANDDQGSFLTHTFGFTAGILLTTIMVLFKIINTKSSNYQN